KKQKTIKEVSVLEESITEPVIAKEEEIKKSIKKRGKIRKQKARKGIHIDKTAQDESKEKREAFMKDKITSASSESKIGIDVIPTAIKPPSIIDWKIIPQSDDLIELYRLVIKKYGANRPKEMYDRVLWGDLKTMFDPPLSDDAIWSLPLQQKMINLSFLCSTLPNIGCIYYIYNLAFLSSENTSITNEVSTASRNFGVDTTGGTNSSSQVSSTPDDLEELDIRPQMASSLLTVRVQRFIKITGRNLDFKGKQLVTFDKSQVECYDRPTEKGHFAKEMQNRMEPNGKGHMVIMAGGMQITNNIITSIGCSNGLKGID
ncbi:hypothetical protein Tco_0620862, partial [Tanacetum coccineum]